LYLTDADQMRTHGHATPVILLPLVLSLAMLDGPALLPAQATNASAPSAASSSGEEGLASFYASRRHGRRTASGETFDNTALVAAHPSLPFGTRVRVTNLGNGRSVEVRIVDRGPSDGRRKEGYVIDLSRAAANRLGFVKKGRASVRLEVIGGKGSK
jgi:rare lipoprotein A